jgi:hypothetical protein
MTEDRYETLKAFLDVDIHTLDSKLDKHAVLNQEVCEHVLAAYEQVLKLETKLEQLKTELDTVSAAARINIREELKDAKVTVDQVKDRAELDQDVISIKTLMGQTKEELDRAKIEHTRWSDLRYMYQSMAKNLDNKTKLIVSGFTAY